MSKVPIILAGTGHRPDKLGGYAVAAENVLRDALHGAMLRFEATHGLPERVISGMALGFDMALAQWAVDNEVPFTAAIPFQGHGDNWPLDARARYLDLLAQAERVVLVTKGGFTRHAMQLRNEWMVNNATHLVVLHNGSGGGTANCVRYARGRIPSSYTLNFWKDWQTMAMARL